MPRYPSVKKGSFPLVALKPIFSQSVKLYSEQNKTESMDATRLSPNNGGRIATTLHRPMFSESGPSHVISHACLPFAHIEILNLTTRWPWHKPFSSPILKRCSGSGECRVRIGPARITHRAAIVCSEA